MFNDLDPFMFASSLKAILKIFQLNKKKNLMSLPKKISSAWSLKLIPFNSILLLFTIFKGKANRLSVILSIGISTII